MFLQTAILGENVLDEKCSRMMNDIIRSEKSIQGLFSFFNESGGNKIHILETLDWPSTQ